MIKITLSLLVLLSAVFFGHILTKSTKEELRDGRKWFKWIIIISIVLTILFTIVNNWVAVLTLIYITIVCLISVRKK